MKLFLDDERSLQSMFYCRSQYLGVQPQKWEESLLGSERYAVYGESDWVIVKNFNEAVEALQKQSFTHISLDHDLGEAKTGYDLAKWLCDHDKWPEHVYVHTANPVGRKNIIDEYNSYKRHKINGLLENLSFAREQPCDHRDDLEPCWYDSEEKILEELAKLGYSE